jgi:hypothetical protein
VRLSKLANVIVHRRSSPSFAVEAGEENRNAGAGMGRRAEKSL